MGSSQSSIDKKNRIEAEERKLWEEVSESEHYFNILNKYHPHLAIQQLEHTSDLLHDLNNFILYTKKEKVHGLIKSCKVLDKKIEQVGLQIATYRPMIPSYELDIEMKQKEMLSPIYDYINNLDVTNVGDITQCDGFSVYKISGRYCDAPVIDVYPDKCLVFAKTQKNSFVQISDFTIRFTNIHRCVRRDSTLGNVTELDIFNEFCGTREDAKQTIAANQGNLKGQVDITSISFAASKDVNFVRKEVEVFIIPVRFPRS